MLLKDEEINALFFDRDETAITEVDKKYGAYLRSVAAGMTDDRRDAEECVNDVYLAAWNSIPPHRPESLQAYLTVLIRHAAYDVIKKSKRARRIPKKLFTPLDDLADMIPGEDAYDALYSKELSGIIDAFVGSLSPRQRYIFMSRYYVNRSVKEIAEKLGVSASTVKKELASVRSGLKEKLAKENFTP
ncbi:MAG: sigma-70 family RNA polymerase sigma factor [Clostridia bacterium]|nr:sigma-70 family RNA polymerase sigma factor [Clostridia bacterium]